MDFDIYESCDGCPYRVADPNCHDTCPGYEARCEENEIKNKERRKDTEFSCYKTEAVTYTNRQLKLNKLKRFTKGIKKT